MFYNSKKLIDEKVLQQYYFETFMLADKAARQKLLPEKFKDYAPDSAVKGLNPECKAGGVDSGSNHYADFVLYAMPKTGYPPINIEIKWNIDDFEKQPQRFNYYNGIAAKGFVVAVRAKGEVCKDTVDNGRIPVKYVDADDFRQWFVKNAYLVASQAISNKFGLKPERQTGPRYWVIYIADPALHHYKTHGRKKHIWAFKDNNNPKNIMNILHRDVVIFVGLKYLKTARNPQPYDAKSKSQGKDWGIDLLEVRIVSNGFHLNYSNKSPYACFDEKWSDVGRATGRYPAETKEYTQFITFMKPKPNDSQYFWRSTKNLLEQKLFPARHLEASEFVDAFRKSMNDSGDAREISAGAFHFVQSLLE